MSQNLSGSFDNATGVANPSGHVFSRMVDISLTIPNTGTVVVERALDGTNFKVVNTYAASAEIVVAHGRAIKTRLRCTVAPPAGQDITWLIGTPHNPFEE